MASNMKLLPMSRISGKVQMDSVKEQKQDGDHRALNVLYDAMRCWDNMSEYRKTRERCKKYTFGDQWSDIVTVDGEDMTEENYILKQGGVPLKNNLIRRLIRNVLGVYRSQMKEPICTARDRDEQQLGETMSTILQYNMQMNRMSEIYGRSMEEFLVSGLVVHRKWYGWRNDKCECWTDYVQPNNFFVDGNMHDFRGWDVNIIGEIHDESFETICTKFATSPSEYKRLREIYSNARDRRFVSQYAEQFGRSRLSNVDFLCPIDNTRCRVIEVWRKESKPRYRCHDYNNGDFYKIEIGDYSEMVEKVNNERITMGVEAGMELSEIPLIQTEWFMDNYWYFYYLTPFGDILKEGETPYEHKSHPYVFKAYPFFDGEIHSFAEDVIDQQRYTNRLITMYDWIMRSSAKGVLLFPEDCLPDDMNINDIADEWSRVNGVIVIKAKQGAVMPQQVSANATNIGISELINLQLKFFEDISGVNGALQGKPGYSNTSGSLYQQQTQNATMSLLDLMDSFSSFVIDAAYKDVKNMQQFYDSKRVCNIAGKSGSTIVYDPKKIRDVEFDLSIVESTQTPAYRQAANEFLMEIWKTGQISLEQMLEHGDFPFADELLQSLKSQNNTMASIPQNVQQQAQQGANMQAVNTAYQAMKG